MMVERAAYQLGVAVDDLRDALAREGLLPESALDVVEHARMCRVGLVEDVLESEIGLAQSVTEVLGEDPSAVCASRSEQAIVRRKMS